MRTALHPKQVWTILTIQAVLWDEEAFWSVCLMWNPAEVKPSSTQVEAPACGSGASRVWCLSPPEFFSLARISVFVMNKRLFETWLTLAVQAGKQTHYGCGVTTNTVSTPTSLLPICLDLLMLSSNLLALTPCWIHEKCMADSWQQDVAVRMEEHCLESKGGSWSHLKGRSN